MEKNKFKSALRFIGIFILTVLFIASFSYTFIVYLTSEKKEIEDEIDIDQICRPYFNSQTKRQTTNPQALGNLLQNISVYEMYTDHPMCLDALLPVLCLLVYPKNDSREWKQSSNLLEECNSSLPTELLLHLKTLSGVYYNITCADGFYLLNNTCRPHCTQFVQLYRSTATKKVIVMFFSTISNVIVTLIFAIVVCFNRKTMLKFPSVLFVYIVLLYSIWPLCILINLLSGRSLVCSDDDLLKSLEQPSTYCVISGVLLIINPSIAVIWIVIVAVMFWKILFPMKALLYPNFDKWIHALVPIFVITFVLPYIFTITTNENFLPAQSGFPSSFCSSRNGVFNFSYIIITSMFLCSLGMFLLMIIFFHIQMRFGWSIWRKDIVMNTAEKKILLLLFIVGSVATFNGVYFTLLLYSHTQLTTAIKRYRLCELPGYITDNENDMTTCNKDELEKYSYTGLSYVSTVFTFALLPLALLLTMINWQNFVHCSWMKVLFRKNVEDQAKVSNLSKLSSLNEITVAKLPEE